MNVESDSVKSADAVKKTMQTVLRTIEKSALEIQLLTLNAQIEAARAVGSDNEGAGIKALGMGR